MSRRSRSLQPPSEHGGADEGMQSSDSSSNLTFRRPRDDKLVKLNVGGRIFETTEATLLSRGSNNFLASLVSSQLPSIRDDQGRFFIDRSGSLFEILLEFLRTGLLLVPENVPQSAILNEADYYGIMLPNQPTHASKMAHGLFVSSKYAENEIVIFSDICTGYIVRGGTSKVQFRYRTDGDGVIEVVWQTEKKPRLSTTREKLLSSSPSTSRSGSASRRSASQTEARASPALVNPLETGAISSSSDEGLQSSFGISSSGYTKSTIWFLQGCELITSASNIYTFAPNLTSFPSSIYTNSKNGIVVYDGLVSGFRLPKSEAPPPVLLSSNFRRNGTEEGIESPPPTSPKSDPAEALHSDDSEGSEDSRDAVFVDIRNQWVKCEYSVVAYCDSVVAYLVQCRPIESIRYKSSLPFPFGGSNEYEWCREKFTMELIVLEDHIIARLVSYNLVRKDRSEVNMQYSAAFHKYHRKSPNPMHQAEP